MKAYGIDDLGNGQLVGEFKSFDPRIRTLPKPQHVFQTQQQLSLIRSGSEYKPEWGVIVYVNASDAFDIRAFAVKFDESMVKGMARRAKQMLTTNPDELPPEGKQAGGNECNNECEFALTCLGYEPWLVDKNDKVDPKAAKKVVSVASKLLKAGEAVEKAAQKKRDVEAELYITLNQAGTNFLKTDKMTVYASKRKGQERLDTKKARAKLIELGVDLKDMMTTTKEGTSLTVEPVV
jgi:hypothetical protein